MIKDYFEDVMTPPGHLIRRVHGGGGKDPEGFHRIGCSQATKIWREAEPLIKNTESTRLLEWGVGSGRVVQQLRKLTNCSLYGCDVDVEAINWCNDNISHIGEFNVNNEEPPLPYPSDYFDCIVGVSVFTHLDERRHLMWLSELKRVCKPGGYIFMTIHGSHYADQLKTSQFIFTPHQTQGLPSWYGTAYIREDYVRKWWSNFFNIVDVVPEGQDIVIGHNTL